MFAFLFETIGAIDWEFIGSVLNGTTVQWRKLELEYGTEELH